MGVGVERVVAEGEDNGRSFEVASGVLTGFVRHQFGLETRCSGRLDSRL